MNQYFSPEKRRRLAPLILFVGAGVTAMLAYDMVPREQPVEVILPDMLRAQLTQISLTYTEDGEAVAGERHSFAAGAPSSLHSSPTLAPGSYDLDVVLSAKDGTETHIRRPLDVPAEGTIRVRLEAAHD